MHITQRSVLLPNASASNRLSGGIEQSGQWFSHALEHLWPGENANAILVNHFYIRRTKLKISAIKASERNEEPDEGALTIFPSRNNFRYVVFGLF